MSPGMDQVTGWSLVSLSGFIFVYYSVWVIILPFVDQDQPIHKFFLPRIYALAGPLIAGVIALTLIGLFVLYMTVSPKKVKKS
ncbi:Dolichol phosphate-mannose biosynthesis regulatory protein [Bulinus truncatus]|nr:Dolichol phosphate-mannose biosynthesis regulatory protein [Bulinus truncatus]